MKFHSMDGSSVTGNSSLSMSVIRSNIPGISPSTETTIQKMVFNRKCQFNESVALQFIAAQNYYVHCAVQDFIDLLN
jgi:hypothetical protein